MLFNLLKKLIIERQSELSKFSPKALKVVNMTMTAMMTSGDDWPRWI